MFSNTIEWKDISNAKAFQFLFLLDNGDKNVWSHNKTNQQINETRARQTLSLFKNVLCSENFSSEPIKLQLEERCRKLTESTENPLFDHNLLIFVAVCQYLNIPCHAFLKRFEKSKKNLGFSWPISSELFMFTENVRIVEICNSFSNSVIYEMWDIIHEANKLKSNINIPHNTITKEILDNKEGLKDLLFLYIIRCLEVDGKLNKIETGVLENILKKVLMKLKNDSTKDDVTSIIKALDRLDNYTMVNKIPGYCLILCVEVDRPGAFNETSKIYDVFRKMGYDVEKMYNPTQRIIEGFLQKMMEERFFYYDSFVVWFLGHGMEDSITLANNKDYPRKEFIKAFSSSKQFKSKPKILFLNTCRGHKTIDIYPKGKNGF